MVAQLDNVARFGHWLFRKRRHFIFFDDVSRQCDFKVGNQSIEPEIREGRSVKGFDFFQDPGQLVGEFSHDGRVVERDVQRFFFFRRKVNQYDRRRDRSDIFKNIQTLMTANNETSSLINDNRLNETKTLDRLAQSRFGLGLDSPRVVGRRI
jgi:hypothetical protein